jgi:hypothetical protein
MKTFRMLDPDSPESLRFTLFLWRVKKPALPMAAAATLSSFVFAVCSEFTPKSNEQRFATKLESKLKPVEYRQVGPWRVRDSYRQAGPWRVREVAGS